MEDVFNQVPCLIFSVSEEGTLLSINETACNYLGYVKEDLEGKKAETIFTLPTRIFQETHLFPLLKMQGKAEEIYITLLTQDGDYLPVLVNAAQKKSNNHTVTFYAGIVVYNRKKFEDELVAAKKAAEKALNENTLLLKTKQQLQEHTEQLDQQISLVNQQNNELRQFSRVVTHDLQEPLRKILVFTNMVLENEDEETQAKAVDRLKNVTERMRLILSGLQQFVWLTEAEIKREKISLNKLLLFVRQRLEKEMSDVSLDLQLEDGVELEGDREQLIYLVQELFSNAIRFSQNEKAVRIHFSASKLTLNKFKNVSGKYAYTDFVRLQIRDEGAGFDNAYNEQVFELFKKLHPKAGSGVGLSLCKKIVENHRGSIAIESKLNEGTTVTILLPLSETEPTAVRNDFENDPKLAETNGSEEKNYLVR